MNPTPVTIVRPDTTTKQLLGRIVSGLLVLALSACILMMMIGRFTTWDLGYWDSLLLLIGVRVLQRSPDYYNWTKSGLPVKNAR